MSRIRLLPEILASQVAAGEVVERPASVVKELVENSIDAGARKIEVIIRRGGISLIRVVDDGCGMDRDDALLSLERHATSKIRTAADLAAIATLGFRGEALPSIASISRFRLTTREREAIAGTEIIVAGGRIETVRDGGEAPGTQIEVRSIFYNLPARRKFLRSENTESRNIEHQLHLQATGHPEIAFVFVRDERVVLQLPAAASLLDRIRDLHGKDLVDRLLNVEEPTHNPAKIRIRGLIGQAGVDAFGEPWEAGRRDWQQHFQRPVPPTVPTPPDHFPPPPIEQRHFTEPAVTRVIPSRTDGEGSHKLPEAWPAEETINVASS